jgi:hypothetical protein
VSILTFGKFEDARQGVPGFYLGLDEATYNEIRAVRRTEIRWLSDSPRLCAYNRTVPFESSATLVGEATHCAVFEPMEFPRRYHIGPPADLKRVSNPKTKAAQKAYEEWSEKNPHTFTKDQWEELKRKVAPKKLLRDHEGALVSQLGAAIQHHPTAWGFCMDPDAVAWNEVTVLWKDPRTGLLCKARIDRLLETTNPHTGEDTLTAIDLKTIVQATTGRIKQACNRGLLHLQSGFYTLGLHVASGGIPADFIFLWLGKEPPFLVRLSRLAPRRRAIVDTEVKRLLSIYDVCQRENRWVDRSHEIDEFDVPRYLLEDAFEGWDDDEPDTDNDEPEEEEDSPF